MTTVFCGENYCSISMVRPLLNVVIRKHLQPQINDDEMVQFFKNTVVQELNDRFNLQRYPHCIVTTKQIASFLDPRYKDRASGYKRRNSGTG